MKKMICLVAVILLLATSATLLAGCVDNTDCPICGGSGYYQKKDCPGC